MANRASAARSRQRKMEHTLELEQTVATLTAQLCDAKRRLLSAYTARDAAAAHNAVLRAKALRLASVLGPGFRWTLD
jgi:hypothetical protein